MKCEECNSSLFVSSSRYESEEGSTDVYSVLSLVCINPKCDNYCGPNLNKPLKVAAIQKNKVN
jgi:hypothetical protein